ncbi:MAG TPA: serine/threonine-protein kinase, partial [Polyangiales bacterium]|nr:serine/threonine-protein kinase [Polyangiales bacterium]
MTASDLPVPPVGERIAGKYRIERELGRGGMGIVFEASHVVTGKRFAVKWLLPALAQSSNALERFIREARVAGRVTHPNLVEIYDIGEAYGSSYMVMELLEGESLSDRLLRVGRLSVEEACAILLPCMRGLARAHTAGVIHRDLKPANIFLCKATADRDELPKLVDFGIAKVFAAAGELAPAATQEGALIGTPDYMAPEQVRGAAIDARTDVYALGIVLYEVFAGRRPFRAKTVADMVLQLLAESPQPLAELAPDVPAQLVAAVERAMSRDPAARFQTIEELARALEPFARGLRFDSRGATPAPVPAPPEASPNARSLRVPALIAGVLIIALGGTWIAVRDTLRDPEPGGAAGHGP